jgi:hypothetical protein
VLNKGYIRPNKAETTCFGSGELSVCCHSVGLRENRPLRGV